MGPGFHLLCQDVTGITLACDMEDFDEVILNPFTGSVVTKFQMGHILHGGSIVPTHSYSIFIVN